MSYYSSYFEQSVNAHHKVLPLVVADAYAQYLLLNPSQVQSNIVATQFERIYLFPISKIR